MKMLQTIFVIALALATVQAGCPLGLDKLFQQRLEELQKLQAEECGTEEFFTNGACRLRDISPLPNTYQVSSDLEFSWGYPDKTFTSIDIRLQLDRKAWVGIGFGTSMTNTDMIITNVLGTGVDVYEAYSTKHGDPPKMENQSAIKVLGYEVSANRVIVKFNRQMRPSQTNGYQPFAQLSANNQQALVFAYGKPDQTSITYHNDRHFQVELALVQTPVQCLSPRLLLNGVCNDNDLTTLPNFQEIKGSNATISWGFPNKESVDFIYQLKNRSWFGIGFGKSMTDTDMVIAQIQDNTVTLIEAYSVGHHPPQEISNQSGITLLGYQVNSDSIQVKFNKLLQPNINTAAQLAVGQTYEWVTAYSVPGVEQLTYHNGNHYGFEIKLADQSSFSLF